MASESTVCGFHANMLVQSKASYKGRRQLPWLYAHILQCKGFGVRISLQMLRRVSIKSQAYKTNQPTLRSPPRHQIHKSEAASTEITWNRETRALVQGSGFLVRTPGAWVQIHHKKLVRKPISCRHRSNTESPRCKGFGDN